jgi:Glycosyltransferase family 87
MGQGDFRLVRTRTTVLAYWAGLYAVVLLILHVVGSHRRGPDESLGSGDAAGGLVPAVRQLLGRPDPRDFYIDYASAHAMLHGLNAYENSNLLFKGLGPAWAVQTANPHPPTLMPLVAPFAVLNYGAALSAWALLMTFLYVASIRLMGVRLSYSIALAVGIAITFPGAYGIGNPVPIVGFGVALAYRFRYEPALAGLGIAVAAMPKGSGLLLAIPFLAAGRVKTLFWAAGFYVTSALVPLLWQADIWRQYFAHGTKAISANANRDDNASILRLIRAHLGVHDSVTVVILVAIAVAITVAQRDLFWSPVWLMVATLPIAWMYSLLTLLPLLIFALATSTRRVLPLVILTTALTIGCPPLGIWPTRVFPVVVLMTAIICALARSPESTLWFGPGMHLRAIRSRRWSIKQRQTTRLTELPVKQSRGPLAGPVP